jgi:hypothetical protein
MERPSGQTSASARPAWWWIFDPRRSLRARAALLVGTVTLAFTAVVIWITTGFYRRSIEQNLGAHFETLAFQLSDKIDRTVYERYRTLILASNLDALRRWETAAGDRRRVLETLQEATPDFAWIGFADARGRMIAGTRGALENQDVANRGWFRSAREQPYVGPLREVPELARETSGSSEGETAPRFLELAVPVTAADGNFGGVLISYIRWGWSRDVQASVVSDLAARERIAATLYQGGEVLLDSGGHGWTHPPEAPAIGEGRRFRGSLVERTPEGATFLTGFARSRGFREYRGIGWLAVVRQPVQRAFASVPRLQRSIALWGLTLSVVATMASWIAASRVVRRMRSVRASAIRIHEGDILAVLPRPPGETEMSHMCRALSDLVEDLRAKQDKTSPENPHSTSGTTVSPAVKK